MKHPYIINAETYYLAFYEVERSTKTVNLLPKAIDAGLDENGYSPVLESAHVTRSGKWFIALTVTDEALKDALQPAHKNHPEVLAYVDHMRIEYANTVHYIEVCLRSKPIK